MIVFGTVLTEPEPYERYARPGIRTAAEADSAVHVFAASGPVARGFNLLCAEAARHDDLEALVLVHEHAELSDPAFAAKVRAALADPDVAVVGCAGATGVRSAAWWEGTVHAGGSVVHRYTEHGGGDLRAFAWADPRPVPARVDAVEEMLVVLSPWAVRNMDFDEGLDLGSSVVVDYCARVRQEGRAVLAADLGVVLHKSLELIDKPELWAMAHRQLAEKWDGQPPGEPARDVDWQARARRAEADREAARSVTYSRMLDSEARLRALERRFKALEATPGWKATAPLRRLNKALADFRAR